jgi:hypothetical protein
MPRNEENGVPAVPEGYTGKVIAVMECPLHGAHINLDLRLPAAQRWDMATFLASTLEDGDAALPVDQMTPEQAETFARDLLDAAHEAREMITQSKACGRN